MSWFRKLMPPKIKHEGTQQKKAVPGVVERALRAGGAVLHRLENNSRLSEVYFHRLSKCQRSISSS
jgi:hypothetical protein